MRRTVILLLVFLAVSTSWAAGWKKAYFGATKAGSWARYANHSSEPAAGDWTTTYLRLPDDGSQLRLQMESRFPADRYPVSYNRYTLKSAFAYDHDLIDFGPAIVSGEIGTADSPMKLEGDMLAAVSKGLPVYGPVATFKGVEKVEGRSADHYTYTIKHAGDPSSVETGDLWLSDAVPFGVVRQTSTTKDSAGKTSTFEEKLIASGTKPEAGMEMIAAGSGAPETEATRTLKEAFDEGLIQISAVVDDKTKDGAKVHLHIEVKEDKPLTIIVPKGRTSLHVDMPLDDFVLEVTSAQTLKLTGEHAADLDVRQVGEQRAIAGKFQISTYEGSPLWSGSATVGWVKK